MAVFDEMIRSGRNHKTQSTNQHIINVSRLAGLTSRLTNHMGIITTAGVGIRENITREREREKARIIINKFGP